MLRVGLTGAHGTGKTTLIERLPSRLEACGVVATCREAPRLITDAVGDPEFFRRGNNTPARQALIFLQHLIEERRQARRCDVLITDRTLVDHLAYSIVLFPEIMADGSFIVYQRAMVESLKDYDVIFKLPIEFAAVDDGVREADVNFQSQIDEAIDRLYDEAKIEPVVLRGSRVQRVDFAAAKIEQLMGRQQV